MKILITEVGHYSVESQDFPEVGRYYNLEDAVEGTRAQGKTFHALIKVWWESGQHPKWGGGPFADFKDLIKRDLGAGFESFVYATIDINPDGFYRPRIHTAKTFEEVPEHIRKDPDMKLMIRGRLKSWADYTKKERQKTIDNVIDDMLANGVSSKKFDEILKGIGWNDRA
jgi:hypothetical protein